LKSIGITGPIASGKSTVASLLKEKGAMVIDADRIARDVVEPDKPAWKEIVAYFGEDVLLHDRRLNRRKLGKIVFENPDKLEVLNKAIHPPVIDEINKRVKHVEAEYGDGKVVVIDVPLLIEVGLHKQCDLTVVVTADKNIRRQRLQEKGLTKEEAESRVAAQSEKEKLEEQADIVIENNGPFAELEKKVDELWDVIHKSN